MGVIKKYKPKKDNLVKLELYLKKINNGREEDKRTDRKGK